MSCQGYAPATVKVYLSALSYWLKVMGMNDLTESFILQKMLKGMDNLYSTADTHKPITKELLIRIMNALTFVCSSVYETKLFRSALLLAFFALLRVGEITIHKTLGMLLIKKISSSLKIYNQLMLRFRFQRPIKKHCRLQKLLVNLIRSPFV